jgi:hypothetical protein
MTRDLLHGRLQIGTSDVPGAIAMPTIDSLAKSAQRATLSTMNNQFSAPGRADALARVRLLADGAAA